MSHLLRAERSTDHPTRERSDHANVDPRRPKHPKVAVVPARVSEKRERPAARG
jgi:hypothetical protein